MQVRQDTQLAMTFPFVAFCHYSEQFPVSQAEQFSDGLCGQKHYVVTAAALCEFTIVESIP